MAKQPAAGPGPGNAQPQGRKRRVIARITKAEGEKQKDGPVEAIELNIRFEEVLANKDLLEVHFIFTAWYQPALGYVSMKGVMIVESDPEEATRVAEQWARDKNMENEMAMNIMHNINYKCGTEAVLITKLIDLPAPMVPPKLQQQGPAPGRPQPPEATPPPNRWKQ